MIIKVSFSDERHQREGTDVPQLYLVDAVAKANAPARIRTFSLPENEVVHVTPIPVCWPASIQRLEAAHRGRNLPRCRDDGNRAAGAVGETTPRIGFLEAGIRRRDVLAGLRLCPQQDPAAEPNETKGFRFDCQGTRISWQTAIKR